MTPAKRRAVITRLGVPRDERDQRGDGGDARLARGDGAPRPRPPRAPAGRARSRRATAWRARCGGSGRASARRSASLEPGSTSALREAVELFARAGHVESAPAWATTSSTSCRRRRACRSTSRRTSSSTSSLRARSSPPRSSRSPGPPLPLADGARARARAVAALQVRVHVPRRRDVRDDLRRGGRRDGGRRGARARRAEAERGRRRGWSPRATDGREQIAPLRGACSTNFVEGYRVAARGLGALLKGPLAAKDVVKRAIPTGERMFLAGEIARREAVSRPAARERATRASSTRATWRGKAASSR